MISNLFYSLKDRAGLLGIGLLVSLALLGQPARTQAQERHHDQPLVAGTTLPNQFVAASGSDTGPCTDSAQPCRTITYALSQAGNDSEIRVAAGLYPEAVQVSQRITLRGGFTVTNWITPSWTVNTTVLDGQSAYRPLTIQADNVTVEGFTVRNGNATASDRTGGGIYIGGGDRVDRTMLVNLRLENNLASTVGSGAGGGLYAEMGSTNHGFAQLNLHNVTVISNTATTGNLAGSGGGMFIVGAGASPLEVRMTNVTVQGNTAGHEFSSSGGGMMLRLNGGHARLEHLRILNNRAAPSKTLLGGPSRGGGIYMLDGGLSIRTGLITGNSGERGDGLALQATNEVGVGLALNFVTVADNYQRAEEAGAIVYSEGSYTYMQLANTLLSGNPVAFASVNHSVAPEAFLHKVLIDDNVSTVISSSLVITGTPLRGAAAFVDAPAGDFHLRALSAAVDKGSNVTGLVDLDGVQRPQGATTDIGAFEFMPTVRSDQTITFGKPADRKLGDLPFTLTATASSNLPVSFTSNTPGVCTVSGNTVTLITTGSCSITATQEGNALFNPATPVTQRFAVTNQRDDDSVHKVYLAVVQR